MIQRIQSVYLLGIVILNALLFFIPFGKNGATGEDLFLNNNHFTMIIGVAQALIAIYTILQFKDRKKQLKLVKLVIALIIGFFAASHLAVHEDPMTFSIDAIKNTFAAGIILQFVNLILALLANKAIKKDDELVRSVDRLR